MPEQLVIEFYSSGRLSWLTRARGLALQLGRFGDQITIDDVREVCPPPEFVDPRVMGAVFRNEDWVCIGYRKSKRNTCHRRPIGIFQRKTYEAKQQNH